MDESNNTNMGDGVPKGGSSGPIIAIIVVLVIIILGGLYFWNQNKIDNTDLESGNSTALESINTQSSSDNATDIEADLNATNVDNLDAELNAL